jgi:Melibiase
LKLSTIKTIIKKVFSEGNGLVVLLFFCTNLFYGQDNLAIATVGNDKIQLSYFESSKTVKAVALASEKTFSSTSLNDYETTSYKREKVNHPTFGKGEALIFDTKDGNAVSFTIYNSNPFVFVEQLFRNKGATEIDIQTKKLLSFSIDLQKPTNEIKTLGTGGLLDVDKNPGSYVFLTTVDPTTRNGVVSGWLTNEKGSGVLFSKTENNLVQIDAKIEYGHFRIPARKTEHSETLVMGYFDDARFGEEQFADLLAKENKIKLRERTAVYCTWYSEKNGGAGSEASSIEIANFISNNLKRYGLGVVQIDDLWQDGGKYNGPTRGFDRVRKEITKGGFGIDGKKIPELKPTYPNGMQKTTKAIADAGLSAGIWWMPFARNHQDPEYKDRQDWFAYRTNGKPFETNWGGTSLDLTNPKVQNHLKQVSKTLQDWGFNYFKMDGLWTGTVTEQIYINDGYKNDSIGNCKPSFNPYIPQIQAFRNGLRLLRKATNNKVFFSGCAISQNMRSFGASIGLVDAMRIGPDFNHDGEGIRTGAIRASRLYFLNGRVWWNDPDPCPIREKGNAATDGASKGIGSLTRAKLLPSFVAVSGQFFLSSDWLPNLPDERLEIMKRTMASHTGVARPVDAFSKSLPSIWLASDSKTGTERNVIGLYNWELTPQTIQCDLAWAGLKANTNYYGFDFWNNRSINDIETSISEELIAESCKIIAVRAKTNHPVVVSTSQHVTQGMIDLLKENWNNNILFGESKLIADDPYEIRIAGINDGEKRQIKLAKLSKKYKDVSIEILPSSEVGWIRILIKGKESQSVKWQIQFEK